MAIFEAGVTFSNAHHFGYPFLKFWGCWDYLGVPRIGRTHEPSRQTTIIPKFYITGILGAGFPLQCDHISDFCPNSKKKNRDDNLLGNLCEPYRGES